jgi:uncharacterized protein
MIICQRCLTRFSHTYENHTSIAACTSEAWAQKLMSDYETMVVGEDLDLRLLLTDELYLYSPENHPDRHDCSLDTDGYRWLF